MKKQIGIWISSDVWEAYKDLCSREKLRPAEPIEKFVEFVLRNGSASTVSNMMQSMAEARSEGFQSYVRVLLDKWNHDIGWIGVDNEKSVSIGYLLLNALKDVADPQLRGEVQEALMIKQRRKQARDKRETGEQEGEEAEESEVDSEGEEAEGDKMKGLSVDELQKKMSELKRLRELVRRAKGS
jgi:hypothetical protein